MGSISREQLGEWLSAYLDGEVNDEQRALIEKRLREDGAVRRQYEEMRRTVELVRSLPRHTAPKSIAADVQAYTERSELVGGPSTQAGGIGRKRSPLVPLLSMAATLALVATGVWYVSDLADTSAPKGDTLVDATKAEGKGASPKRSSIREAESEPATPAVPGTLLASATFDQKLQSGLGMKALREHRFANEPVHLRVTVGSEVERDIVAARLVGKLKKQAASDLRRDDDISAEESSGGRFFFEGSDDVNFTEAGQRQVLVRVSRAELQDLMEEMSRATTGKKDFSLAAGPISVRGYGRTQAMITGLEESTASPGDTAHLADAGRGASYDLDLGAEVPGEGKTEETESSLDGLFKVVGLDAAEFKQDLASAPVAEETETTGMANNIQTRRQTGRVAAGSRGPAKIPRPVAQEPSAESDSSQAKERFADATGEKKSAAVAPSSTRATGRDDFADEDAAAARSKRVVAPDSLVSRRMKALDKDSRPIDRAEPPAAAGRARDAGRTELALRADGERRAALAVASPPAGYVTLVIKLAVDRPPASKTPPSTKPRPSKPAKDEAKQ